MPSNASETALAAVNKIAAAFGWPDDECFRAVLWFCGSDEGYDWQLESQPKPLYETSTQEESDVFEDELENFVIDLEEYANTGGMPMSAGHRDDVDWEVVADYLMAVAEYSLA